MHSTNIKPFIYLLPVRTQTIYDSVFKKLEFKISKISIQTNFCYNRWAFVSATNSANMLHFTLHNVLFIAVYATLCIIMTTQSLSFSYNPKLLYMFCEEFVLSWHVLANLHQ
jgi:hypothetical protein